MGRDSLTNRLRSRFPGAARIYRALALLLLNACTLFLLLNVFCFLYFWVADRLARPAPARRSGTDPELQRKVYPDYDSGEISQIWQGCMTPLVYEPFVDFMERPRSGKWVNVSEPGFRSIEGQCPWPPDPGHFNVFVFGGSTTFGYGVADHDTWPSHLQAILARRMAGACVYNFAQGYYYSCQERALFERLLLSGHVPRMAVFMDGVNDFCFVDDDTRASKKLALALEKEPDQDKVWQEISRTVPLARAIDRIASHFHPPSADPPDVPRYDDPGVIQRIIDRYWDNKKMIEAVSHAYGVTAVFVWQPVPSYGLDPALHPFARDGFLTITRSVYGYPAMAEWIRSHPPGNDFVWLADIQRDAKEPLYIDLLHYSPRFHAEVARQIDVQLGERGLYDEALGRVGSGGGSR